ncbi:hypothetical protein SISSUDRAFT_351774 [Sistotremastrum suecicum HHB10207 ss-3]|uniref:Uncharacterized protein n=1 Tax=Sistotremastrum suecicum HHB10207 ss-3 TaxID=1314776 RepID=A0A166G307_9AGAM|nr:hypothetical protein SISSUDRAFT_351774 [Sistotremastrum suecicum HHB10207 ss-3]
MPRRRRSCRKRAQKIRHFQDESAFPHDCALALLSCNEQSRLFSWEGCLSFFQGLLLFLLLIQGELCLLNVDPHTRRSLPTGSTVRRVVIPCLALWASRSAPAVRLYLSCGCLLCWH